MSDIAFTALKLVVMIVTALVARYLVPWLKDSFVMSIVLKAVYMAQQVYYEKPGADRKKIVLEYVNKILAKKHLSISEEELDILIEAAVKQLRMEESLS